MTYRPDDGPQPPVGLRYPRVRYKDTDGNGFIDRIEYLTVEYTGKFGTEGVTEKLDRVVSLLDYADETLPPPDVSLRTDPRVDAPLSGWSLAKWDGRPLRPVDFAGTPVKAGYDKMSQLFYYRKKLSTAYGGYTSTDPIFIALKDTVLKFGIQR